MPEALNHYQEGNTSKDHRLAIVEALAFPGYAQLRPPDFAVLDQVSRQLLCGGAADSEVDALRFDQAGRVDANDLTGAVD